MEPQEIKSMRQKKLKDLQAKGICPYGGKFKRTGSIAQTLSGFSEGQKVSLAGRIVANRKHGKVLFIDLEDQSGKIQLYIKAEYLGEEKYELLKESHNIVYKPTIEDLQIKYQVLTDLTT